jgi:DNA polymerase-3 subunit alpha
VFSHLHVHTEYSLLDGLSRISSLVKSAKDQGMSSIAMTDHGGLYGAVDFYSEAKAAGLNPIIGCELYLAQDSRHSKTPNDRSPYHLLLLAKNNTGYSNLTKLVTAAHLEGFYYKPRVDKELLEKHSDGLIVLSGCPNGEIPRMITNGDRSRIPDAVDWYQKTFGPGNFYFELQRHADVPNLETINQELILLSKSLDVPLVATNDLHYVDKDDADLQDVLLCIHTNTNLNDPKRLKLSDDSYYLKSSEEMTELFKDIPEAITNTERIAQQCKVEMDFTSMHLPSFDVPTGASAQEYLMQICWEGATKRFGSDLPTRVQEQINYELDVVLSTNFSDYFLVVWDIAAFARSQDILFGVRGSAASSLILYCLGVTDINPLDYNLVFERFLNPERKEMPDIDMDIQDDRREEVIEYVVRKHGHDKVAQIITFGTLGARAAIRDVGRAMARAYAEIDEIARLIPLGTPTLNSLLDSDSDLQQYYKKHPENRTVIDTAARLEGSVRHVSTHAAAVVVSDEPLLNYIPLQRATKGTSETAVTQYPMDPIGKLGLLKIDFLGLTNLTILDKTVKLINQQTDSDSLELPKIPLDNSNAFDLLASGETTSIFQLESSGMRRYIKELRPTSIAEISAMIALYRPGPMEHIQTFIEAKHGRAPITYPHEDLMELLHETYGVIVYQDQVLHIVRKLAGYSLGQADVVRKAMGKKIPEIMEKEKENFIAGATARGYSLDTIEAVFSLLEPFAGYAFNKAHSVSYALIAYWTAYMKANYPVEYMCSVLNASLNNNDRLATITSECKRMGISILPPSINSSMPDYSVAPRESDVLRIRTGLEAIKNVGRTAIEPLVKERTENGHYTSVEDLCERTGKDMPNKRTLESMIKVGTFDELGYRQNLLNKLDTAIATAQRAAHLKAIGQTTFFNMFTETENSPQKMHELEPLSGQNETSLIEQLNWERELLGMHISITPVDHAVTKYRGSLVTLISDINAETETKITIGGIVSTTQSRVTQNGKPFITATIELQDGPFEIVLWDQKKIVNTSTLLSPGQFICIVGQPRIWRSSLSMTAETIYPIGLDGTIDDSAFFVEKYSTPENRNPTLSPITASKELSTTAKETKTVVITIPETQDQASDKKLLYQVLELLIEFEGDDKVQLEIQTSLKLSTVVFDQIETTHCPGLVEKMQMLLGPHSLKLKISGSQNNPLVEHGVKDLTPISP